MSNIIVTNKCNLRCPYCFADDNIKDCNEPIISIERFQAIVDKIAKENQRIGIIGGEPFTHPQIDDLLMVANKAIRNSKSHATIFTNGILMESHMSYIGERMSALVNYNSPNVIPKPLWDKLTDTLEHCYDIGWFEAGKVRLGINLYHELEDFSYFVDACKRYKPKSVRTSFVAPTYGNWAKDKEAYFTQAVPKFLKFCDAMSETETKIGPDCSMIPSCYFTQEQLDKITPQLDLKMYGGIDHMCRPVCDITPDGEAISCFGCGERTQFDQFDSLKQLRDYLLIRKNVPLLEYNRTGRCKDCKKFELLECSGGCLAFAKYNRDNK